MSVPPTETSYQFWETLPETAELVALGWELVDASGRELEHMSGRNRSEQDFIGMLSASRCRRLLISILILVSNNCDDAVGVLLRSLFEFYLLGSYAQQTDSDGLIRLRQHWQHHYSRLFPEGVGEFQFDDARSFSVKQLAEETSRLLREAGVDRWTYPSDWYEHFYRLESATSTHANLGAFSPHIVGDARKLNTFDA